MTAYQAALAGLVGSVVVFYLIAQRFGGRPNNVMEFFHDPNVPRNASSLIAANLGLGQGIAMVLMGTQFFGVLFLIVPFMIFAGQKAFSRFVRKADASHLFVRGMLASGLGDALDEAAGKRVHFQQWTTGFVILAYIMGLVYEVLVSARWLNSALFPTIGIAQQAFISCLLLAFVMTYTVSGGYKTVQRTDIAQVICGILLVVGIIYLLAAYHLQPGMQNGQPVGKSPIFPTDAATIIGFATLALAPFNSQFYGILNQAAASHQSSGDQRRRLFNWSSWVILTIYLFLAIAALYFNNQHGGAQQALEQLLAESAKGTTTANILGITLATVGMTAVIMSTADTLMIVVTQALHEGFSRGFSGGNSQTTGTTADLRKVRRMMLFAFPCVFLVLVPMWFFNTDAFNLLFAIAAPCEVIAPLIAVLLLLAHDNNIKAILSKVSGRWAWLHVFYLLSVLVFVGSLVANSIQWPWARAIGFFGFLLSSILACLVFRNSRHLAKR